MLKHSRLNIILIFCGMIYAISAFSHPYHSPLTFIKHNRDGGGVVYTNIPKSCFSDGLLICHDYYQLRHEQKDTASKPEPVIISKDE